MPFQMQLHHYGESKMCDKVSSPSLSDDKKRTIDICTFARWYIPWEAFSVSVYDIQGFLETAVVNEADYFTTQRSHVIFHFVKYCWRGYNFV